MPYEPMLAVASTSQSGRAPVDIRSLPPKDWTFEVKVDGVRTILDVDNGRCRLWAARNANDITKAFPEIVATVQSHAKGLTFVLDGELELVAQEEGTATLADLVGRTQRTKHVTAKAIQSPAWFVAFDLLSAGGVESIGLPLVDRQAHMRRLLDQIESPGLVPVVRDDDGVALLARTREQKREGVIAKRRASLYRPGTRSKAWVKFKNTHVLLCVAYGYQPGTGSRSHFGALQVAVLDGTKAVDVGTVGSGLSDASITVLRELLDRGSFPVVEVECLGLSTGGRLRQPVFRRLRPDARMEEALHDQLHDLPVTT